MAKFSPQLFRVAFGGVCPGNRICFSVCAVIAVLFVCGSGFLIRADGIRSVSKPSGGNTHFGSSFSNSGSTFTSHGSNSSGGSSYSSGVGSIPKIPLVQSLFDAPSVPEKKIEKVIDADTANVPQKNECDTAIKNYNLRPIPLNDKAYLRMNIGLPIPDESGQRPKKQTVPQGLKQRFSLRDTVVYYPRWGNKIYSSFFFNIGMRVMSNLSMIDFSKEGGYAISFRLKRFFGIRECFSFTTVSSESLAFDFEWKEPDGENGFDTVREITMSYHARSFRIMTDFWLAAPGNYDGEALLFAGVGVARTSENTRGLLIKNAGAYLSDYEYVSLPRNFRFTAPVLSGGIAYNLPYLLFFTSFAFELRYSVMFNSNKLRSVTLSDNCKLTHDIMIGIHLRI